MRYFTHMADQWFKTGPGGERLFFPYGPWFRPYVLPDPETERRIHQKLLWFLRALIGGLIVGLPLLFFWVPAAAAEPIYLIAAMVAITAIMWLGTALVLGPELTGLRRLPSRLPVARFYGEMAKSYSLRGLLIGLAGCLVFVAIGLTMVATGQNVGVGAMVVVIFAIFGLPWGYAAWLKRNEIMSGRDAKHEG